MLCIACKRTLGEIADQLVESSASLSFAIHAVEAPSIVEENYIKKLGIWVAIENVLECVESTLIIFAFVIVFRHFCNRLTHASTIGEMIKYFLIFLKCTLHQRGSTALFCCIRHPFVGLGDPVLSFTSKQTVLHVDQAGVNADGTPVIFLFRGDFAQLQQCIVYKGAVRKFTLQALTHGCG